MANNAPGKNYLFNISLDAAGRYIDSISHFNGPRKHALYSEATQNKMNGTFALGEKLYRQIASSSGDGYQIENMLYLDSKTYLPGDILTKVDRMSMASSFVARSPLLDHKLIDYVTLMPSQAKQNSHSS